MLETGEPRHLAEWQEYYELEPFGQDWLRTSRATASIINQVKSSTPREEPLRDSDYLDDEFLLPRQGGANAVDEEISAKLSAADSIEGLGF